MHTLPTPDIGGVNLLELIQRFGLEDHVYLPRPDVYPMGGMSREGMADLYNTFDILAMPSNAEGFGLPLIEAQACGVPTIATDFTTMPELCNSGWLIKPEAMYLSPLLSWQALASINSIQDRIAYAYNNRDEVIEKGKEAREFAKQYSWDKIVNENWLPMLDEFEDRIKDEEKSYTQMPNIDSMVEPFLKVEDIEEPDSTQAPDVELPEMGPVDL
jgi:glycosyltransferase involved in cell wall biosynthesis